MTTLPEAQMAKRRHILPAAEFKARCLAVMDEVEATGHEVVITKHGRPVAKLVAVDEETEPLFGRLAGWVTHEGDLVTPLDLAWEADAG
jgi:prevent-host-death family protein